jgi:hypothetical protein
VDIHPSCKLRKNHAEANVVVAVAGRVVVPVRDSAVGGVVVPATAALHAVRAFAVTTLFFSNGLHVRFQKIFSKKF